MLVNRISDILYAHRSPVEFDDSTKHIFNMYAEKVFEYVLASGTFTIPDYLLDLKNLLRSFCETDQSGMKRKIVPLPYIDIVSKKILDSLVINVKAGEIVRVCSSNLPCLNHYGKIGVLIGYDEDQLGFKSDYHSLNVLCNEEFLDFFQDELIPA